MYNEYRLSSRSRSRLNGVHPDLVRVVERAIKHTRYDFGVLEGVRSQERQRALVASGKSTTMASKHLVQPVDGYGHAVDLYAWVDGKATWDYGVFRGVIQSMFLAAIDEGVPIEAGGLWRTFIDSPHFQLAY